MNFRYTLLVCLILVGFAGCGGQSDATNVLEDMSDSERQSEIDSFNKMKEAYAAEDAAEETGS